MRHCTCSTEEQKQADAQGLFDFCAECLDNFVKDTFGDEDGKVDLEEPIPMGFTFSYPCECVASVHFGSLSAVDVGSTG